MTRKFHIRLNSTWEKCSLISVLSDHKLIFFRYCSYWIMTVVQDLRHKLIIYSNLLASYQKIEHKWPAQINAYLRRWSCGQHVFDIFCLIIQLLTRPLVI